MFVHHSRPLALKVGGKDKEGAPHAHPWPHGGSPRSAGGRSARSDPNSAQRQLPRPARRPTGTAELPAGSAPLRSAPPGKEGQWEGAGSAGSVPGGGWGEAAGELGCAATPLAINGGAAPSGGSGAAGEERAHSPAQPSSYQLSPAQISSVQLRSAQSSSA